ncbi:MAG: metal ABC transporter ATP-binding protein [Streptococcus parasanguinis]
MEDLSLTIQGPTILGILGPNGAGKSTLIKAMLGLLPHVGKGPSSIKKISAKYFNEWPTSNRNPLLISTSPSRCESVSHWASIPIFLSSRRKSKEDLQKVENALKLVNLLDLADRQIGQLSGGQFQRVLIARCLVQEADVIFLDEPFAGIDSVSEDIIMQTLQTLKQEGKTILIVHHDLSKVPAYFDQVLLLHRQLIAFGKTEETFTKENLHAAYGHELFIGGGIG